MDPNPPTQYSTGRVGEKIKIPRALRGPSVPQSIRDDYVRNVLNNRFRQGIEKVLNGEELSFTEKIELHSMTFGNTGCGIYDGIENISEEYINVFSSYIGNIAEERREMLNSNRSSEVVETYVNAYQDLLDKTNKVKAVCVAYVTAVNDIQRANVSKKLMSLDEIAHCSYFKKLFVPFHKNLLDSVIRLYHQVEYGNIEQDPVTKLRAIKKFVGSLFVMVECEYGANNGLCMYEKFFEKYFIESRLQDFNSSKLNLSQLNSVDYINRVEAYRSAEKQRLGQAFPIPTESKILQEYDQIFIVDQISKVYDVAKYYLIKIFDQDVGGDSEGIKNFTKLHQIFERIGNLELKKEFSLAFLDEAMRIWKLKLDSGDSQNKPKENREDLIKSVKMLMFMHAEMKKILEVSFNKSKQIFEFFNASLIKFFRERKEASNIAISSQINVFLDSILKKHEYSQAELDQAFKFIMEIYKVMDNKDEFVHAYNKFLVNRLISGVSLSLELEENFISNYLGKNAGLDITQIPKNLIADIRRSQETTRLFQEFQKNGMTPASFNVDVLTLGTNNWKIKEKNPDHFTVNCPETLGTMLTQYVIFHQQEKGANRILEWVFPKFHGVIYFRPKNTGDANTNSAPYKMSCSLYQIATLLQFEDGGTKSYAELQNLTGIHEHVLDDHVLGVLTKIKILIKNPKTNEYTLNDEFKRKLKALNINVPIKSSEVGASDADNELTKHRKYRLQAWTVRIMKEKKVCTENELIEKIITAATSDKVGFSPGIPMIQGEIKYLMEKSYLERDEVNTSLIKYVNEEKMESEIGESAN